ncbi:hypothetical protein [Pseudoroseicyclus aestuarii]|uniref:hypothetical protein n=1 Tax=Pseudoroseicyclus aestuarii TaxID=1795041 RepID=UPI0011B3C9A8|nr:hypothetical protein [Pseudoroseicyclus aestuarii]
MANASLRIVFTRNIAALVVVSHVVLLVYISLLAAFFSRSSTLDLLTIAAPLTAAYSSTALVWLMRDTGSKDGPTISSQAAGTLYFLQIVLVAAAFAIVTATSIRGLSFPVEMAQRYFAAIELIFGASIGLISKEFFVVDSPKNSKDA